MAKKTQQVYRVTLVFPLGVTRSVFVKGRNRANAEKRALRKYPTATGVDRSPFPQS
jgi:hypothetical protein